MTLREYVRESKDPLNALVLVTPLFVAYQLGILFTGGIRNGVDFVTDALTGGIALLLTLVVGSATKPMVLTGYLLVNVVVLIALLVAIAVLRKKGQLKPKLWPLLLLESGVYALLFGSFVTMLMRAFGLGALLSAGAPEQMTPVVAFVSSVGAGLYEEIVFRLFLMGGLVALFERGIGMRPVFAALAALVVSSAIFSLVHHIGPMGDPFALGTFFFRFFAGVVLAGIFAVRGFAVAVYTHALYDVLVLVIRGAL